MRMVGEKMKKKNLTVSGFEPETLSFQCFRSTHYSKFLSLKKWLEIAYTKNGEICELQKNYKIRFVGIHERGGGMGGGIPPQEPISYLVTYKLFESVMYCVPPPYHSNPSSSMFVGNIAARNWVNFGHPETSTFCQKESKPILRRKNRTCICHVFLTF